MEDFAMFSVFFDESSSDDDDEVEILLLKQLYSAKAKVPKITNFIENVVDCYTDEMFRENFRMYRTTFETVLNLVKEQISTTIVDIGHPTIDARTQLLVAIWYFATPDSYRSICSRFNIGKATGLRIVRRVTKALIEISPNIIKWPTGEYLEQIKQDISRKGFPGTIGFIDGCYIPIPLPREDGVAYINRKNVASVILQVSAAYYYICILKFDGVTNKCVA